ncbi:MAG: PDZ domain-containing protein, partial [Rhodobacteraceae bacterium]|nr:PDZ domain-containing protein [Paracoccaceae bacterium]
MQKLSSIKFIVLIASFLSLLSIQPVLSQSQAVGRNILDSIQLIPETLSRIHGEYVEEVDNHELIQAAVDGMLRSLDPHSGYITPEEMIANQEQTTGEFGGLGMTVTTEDGFIKIISPIDDTPAYRAGLQAGDFIIEINGETVLDKSLQDGVELLRGPPGSEVTLTIKREELEPFMVTLTR